MTDEALFLSDLWRQTLAHYAAVTDLTVRVYAAGGRAVGEPAQVTPLVELFGAQAREGGLFLEAARGALALPDGERDVTIHERSGLATVSVPLRDAGREVGVAVAGLALVSHLDERGAEQLAREHRLPFHLVWKVVRERVPMSRQRLLLCGGLLGTLAEALLREEARARQLERASAELTEALRSKDEFLAVLSHELRTPLTPILAWTQILRHRRDPLEMVDALDVIERNVRHQIGLVNELLDLNRVQREKLVLEREPHDLRQIVRAAVENVAAAAAAKQLRVDRQAPDRPVPVEADAGRLGQVFANLLSNAVKFTPVGGRIIVTLAMDDRHATVSVRDTGAGIAADFLPFVFDMFRQQEAGMRRQHGGLGVGLALARRLTELHRGTIRAESGGVGRGTEITVTLPLLTGQATLAFVAREPPGRPPRLDGLSVLLVEDSEDTRAAAREMLEHLGAVVVPAGDGREAMALFDATAPDLVLCDLRMPTLDGFELLERLRRHPRGGRVPVIACSGLAAVEDVQRVRQAGFDGYLRKPFDYATLAGVIASARGGVDDGPAPAC